MSFEKDMQAGIEAMVKNHDYNASTNHAALTLEGVPLSKGVTTESLDLHAREFNRLTVMAAEATAEITRNNYNSEAENPILSLDATLNIGNVVINSAHHLSEGEGDAAMYGTSYTAIDFKLDAELNAFQSGCFTRNMELASELLK